MTNQLIYDQSKGKRQLERIRFVWSERDPVVMESVEVVQRSSRNFEAPNLEEVDLHSIATHSVFDCAQSQGSIASTLLALVPPSRRTDAELAQDYPIPEGNMERKKGRRPKPTKTKAKQMKGTDESTFRGAFNNPTVTEILDMQVYLTSKESLNPAMLDLPFVFDGRPDVDQIFADMREEALESDLDRVAVIVCAPARLAHVLRVACVKYSDDDLQFDFHVECQD